MNIKLEPWVGENYKKSSPKILILGESCYGDDSEKSDGNRVKSLVENVISDTWSINFFNKMSNLLSETKTFKDVDYKDFLNSVVFHEYIQEVVSGPRLPLTKQQWEGGKKTFIEVLEKHKPDIIFCFGKRMYQKLPYLDGGIEKVFKVQHDLKEYSSEIWTYDIGGHAINMIEIQHLSSSISYKPWVKIIDKFMDWSMN